MSAIVTEVTFIIPFFQVADSYRVMLLRHEKPHMAGLIYLLTRAPIILHLGLLAFRKAKGYFDVAL